MKRVTRVLAGVICAGAFASTAEAATTVLGQYGTGMGTGAGQLSQPTGVAVDNSGTVYVAEGQLGGNRISVFSRDGTFLRAFGFDVIPGMPNDVPEVCDTATGCKAGAISGNAGAFNGPTSIAFDGSGDLLIADEFNQRIANYTTGGVFINAFGLNVIPGGGNVPETCSLITTCTFGVSNGDAGAFAFPSGVATDATGNIFVADQFNNRISVFDSSNGFIRAFGRDVGGAGIDVCTVTCVAGAAGAAPGQMTLPADIAVDVAGNVAVSEGGNNRVSVFSSAGTFQRAFGNSGPGALSNPDGASFAPDGTLWIGDGTNHRVAHFRLDGTFLGGFGSNGSGPGQFNFVGEVAADCNAALLVADRANHRIQRIGEPGTVLPPPCNVPPIGGGGGGGGGTVTADFTIGKLTLNKKKGTGVLTVSVTAAGTVDLSGKDAKPSSASASAAGDVGLTVKAKGKAKKKLKTKGKAKLALDVGYSPTGGAKAIKSTTVKLKRKRKR